jgi:hypothetical protein
MAIRPDTTYPGQVATNDAAYPYGKAQNLVTLGDGTGTPWEKDLVNDIFGFEQSLLVEGLITPSGVPDKVGASDYLNALKLILSARRAADAAANLELVFQRNPDDQFFDVAFHPQGGDIGKWLAVGYVPAGNGLFASSEDGRWWGADIFGNIVFKGVAAGLLTGAVPGFAAVGAGGFGVGGIIAITPADVINFSATLVAEVTSLNSIAWSPGLARWCAVGDSGAIVTTDDGIAYTVQTADAGYTGRFNKVVWSSLFGLFMAAGSGGEIQVSPNGEDWTEVKNGGANYASIIDTNFMALVLPNGAANTAFLQSLDGNTWNELTLANAVPLASCLFAFRGVLIAIENNSSSVRPAMRFSYDLGATWSLEKVYLRGILNSQVFEAVASDGSRIVAATRGDSGSKGAIYASPRVSPTL